MKAREVQFGQRTGSLLACPEIRGGIRPAPREVGAHENDDVWANMSIYHDNDGDDLWRIIPFDMNLSYGAAYMDNASFSGIQVTNDNLKSFPLYGSSQAIPDGMLFTVPPPDPWVKLTVRPNCGGGCVVNVQVLGDDMNGVPTAAFTVPSLRMVAV